MSSKIVLWRWSVRITLLSYVNSIKFVWKMCPFSWNMKCLFYFPWIMKWPFYQFHVTWKGLTLPPQGHHRNQHFCITGTSLEVAPCRSCSVIKLKDVKIMFIFIQLYIADSYFVELYTMYLGFWFSGNFGFGKRSSHPNQFFLWVSLRRGIIKNHFANFLKFLCLVSVGISRHTRTPWRLGISSRLKMDKNRSAYNFLWSVGKSE